MYTYFNAYGTLVHRQYSYTVNMNMNEKLTVVSGYKLTGLFHLEIYCTLPTIPANFRRRYCPYVKRNRWRKKNFRSERSCPKTTLVSGRNVWICYKRIWGLYKSVVNMPTYWWLPLISYRMNRPRELHEISFARKQAKVNLEQLR